MAAQAGRESAGGVARSRLHALPSGTGVLSLVMARSASPQVQGMLTAIPANQAPMPRGAGRNTRRFIDGKSAREDGASDQARNEPGRAEAPTVVAAGAGRDKRLALAARAFPADHEQFDEGSPRLALSLRPSEPH
jgi:hypothetical protein